MSGAALLYTQRVCNKTRHHPPTHKTDFESDAYTSFIPLAFKVISPYGIPLKYY